MEVTVQFIHLRALENRAPSKVFVFVEIASNADIDLIARPVQRTSL